MDTDIWDQTSIVFEPVRTVYRTTEEYKDVLKILWKIASQKEKASLYSIISKKCTIMISTWKSASGNEIRWFQFETVLALHW